jgi:hypothetical protein
MMESTTARRVLCVSMGLHSFRERGRSHPDARDDSDQDV